MTCRFVRFRISFCLTFVRSFGMGTYATFILLIKYKSSCGKSKNLRFLAGFGESEPRARCAGFSVVEIGNRKKRLRFYASFPEAPHIVPPSFSPISAHEICSAPDCLS